jgi:RNA polymerase sigma factor (sigma-70 family)
VTTFSDAELISRVILDDDRSAFSELVRRHQSNVRQLLRKLSAGNTAVADDCAQETFIKAYRSIRSFQGGASFGTWLYRIAYNSYLSHLRATKNERSHEAFEEESGIPVSAHDERVLAQIDVERAMVDCTERERAALALNYGKDLPHEEIAGILQIPLGTVKTLLLRGKEKIRQRLCAVA